MRRVPGLEVLVLRASDRSPVEEYALRVLSVRGDGAASERAVLGGWEHPAGITRVEGLRGGGRRRLIVEPRPDSGLATKAEEFDFDPAATARRTVLLPDVAACTVRVQDVEGRPVAGSRIEVIDSGGETVAPGSQISEFRSGSWRSAEIGVLIDESITDQAGVSRVIAPVGVPVCVRCTGVHPTWIAQQVVLDQGLVVTVEAGATLRIRFDPDDVCALWREDAREHAALRGSEDVARHMPWVQLRRLDADRGEEVYPASSRFLEGALMDPSGRVTLHGVPEGRWRVSCYRFAKAGGDDFHMVAIDHPEPVQLRNGETAELVFDVSSCRVGTLVGRVFSDGETLAEARLRGVRTLVGRDSTSEPRTESIRVQTDADGWFRRQLPVGRYTFETAFDLPADSRGWDPRVQVRVTPDVDVVVGVATEVDLHADLARADVRLLAPDGEPVRGLAIHCVVPFGGLGRPADPGPTDGEGRTSIFGTAGSFRFRCRVRSLVDTAEFQAFNQQVAERFGGFSLPDALAAVETAYIELDQPVTLSVGGGPEQVLRLPAAWDR